MQFKTILGAASACAIALAATPASAANTFPIGGGNPPDGIVFNTGLDGGGTATFSAGDPFANVVVASLSRDNVETGNGYSDTFTFTLPQIGVGSGNVSTSFTSEFDKLVFTSVTFDNGVDPVFNLTITDDGDGQSVIASNLPVFAGQLNQLTFNYDVTGALGQYGGGITFVAVPEPGTWALMLLGFAGIGLAMRRRRKEEVRVKYAF